MTDWMSLAYPWLKAAHIIFVIFWMAGLFMLPRFYVYHQESPVGTAEDHAWIEREGKIASIIMNPAMLIVWVLGLSLAYVTDSWTQPWLMVKMLLVIGLSGYQGWLMAYRKKLAVGKRTMSGKTLRLINEVPGVVLALIVILVVIRPF